MRKKKKKKILWQKKNFRTLLPQKKKKSQIEIKKMSAVQRDTQGCKFVFTINNVPADHEIFTGELLEEYVCSADGTDERFFTYVCVAPEFAPTSGMPHVQGYCFTRKPVRVAQVVKKFNEMGFTMSSHPWVQKAVGTHEHNFNYVQGTVEKKGNVANPGFREFGVRPTFETQAERQKKDYQVTRDLAMAGKFLEICPQHFICHFRSLVAISERYCEPPADLQDVCGIWVWGNPGTGKSYFARTNEELYGETTKRFYVKNLNKWWCGFRTEDHDRVIIDDFELSAGASLGHFLKIWADRYAFQAEIKGGSSFIRPKTVTITSNYHPLEVFRDALNNSAGPIHGDECIANAILRRFRVFKCEKVGDTRTFTYELGTGTLDYKLPSSPATVNTFNITPAELTPELVRQVMVMPESSVLSLKTPSATGPLTMEMASTTPMSKPTAGTNFRTPESPRNVKLKEYMRNFHVPAAGTQPLTEDEYDTDDEDNVDENDAEKADLALELAMMPNRDGARSVPPAHEVIDLTGDEDEEKLDVQPPKLTRSTTISAVRTVPAYALQNEAKRMKEGN